MRNLSIPRSKLGAPRFPFERSDAGKYSLPGPVVTYQLSPEDIAARYGSPSGVKRKLTRAALKWAAEHAESLAEAAKKLHITQKKLEYEMSRHCVAVPKNCKEKETDTMENLMNESATPCNEPEEAQPETRTVPASSRLTIARAVEMREETIEDLDDLSRIIDLPTSERILSLLNWHRDQYRILLERIDAAFANTEITL